MKTNSKVKNSKGCEYWTKKHNLNTMLKSVIFIRKHRIKSIQQFDEYIQKTSDKRQHPQDKIKAINKVFFEKYKAQITFYENALS